ncbi:MAG: ABC transporter ATP-binding protein [Spirochaetota bacterium]
MTYAPAELSARRLSCGYPHAGRIVLSDLDLELRRGRFLCIIGPNGAGKTTLLRTLAGLLPPVAGDVLLAGTSLTAMRAGERARRLSVVLTHSESPGFMTVAEFVSLGRHPYTGLLARLSGDDRRVVSEAVEHVGLAGLRDRWMSELSDGERQRAAVARALAQAADVMILDEPTAFLDVAARASVMTTLRRIAHATDRLIITTSHDVELVLRTADVVGVVDGGASVRLGSPEDLVLDGSMERLFADSSLRFDPRSGTFRLPHPSGDPVLLVGEGARAHWTAHAIERIGRPVVRSKTDALSERSATMPVVRVLPQNPPAWEVVRPGDDPGPQFVRSLADLAEALRE